MSNRRPIDLVKLQATVSEFTDCLTRRDYDGFCALARTSRLTASDVERGVREYGRSLMTNPANAFTADIVPISGSNPQLWSVVVPLWSQEEGRSDLSLEITVQDSPDQKYLIDIDDLHVL